MDNGFLLSPYPIMHIEQFLQQESTLLTLIQQAKYFQYLDQEIKKWLPPNMTAHFQVIRIRDGMLIIHANSGMAATRLKMLLPAIFPKIQNLEKHITNIHIAVRPTSKPEKPPKNFTISNQSVQAFAHTAEQVRHHPALHQALCQLVQHHQKS